MKSIQKVTTQGFMTLLILMLSLSYGTLAYAEKSGCWAEFYEDAQFKGKSFRLQGSAYKKNLVNENGENWDKRIESILIGPKATVTVYENKNLKLTLKEMAKHPVLMKSLGITKQDILEDSEIILHPGSKVHSFGEYNFYHKIRSLKIECK
jgi:hypothetical protein